MHIIIPIGALLLIWLGVSIAVRPRAGRTLAERIVWRLYAMAQCACALAVALDKALLHYTLERERLRSIEPECQYRRGHRDD